MSSGSGGNLRNECDARGYRSNRLRSLSQGKWGTQTPQFVMAGSPVAFRCGQKYRNRPRPRYMSNTCSRQGYNHGHAVAKALEQVKTSLLFSKRRILRALRVIMLL